MISFEYIEPIDGLRALAVIGVLMGHWLPSVWSENYARFADIGLIMFFLISGYLITGILLSIRSRIEAGEFSRSYGLRRFYIRRALRIFPLYYFVIIIAILGLRLVREDAIPHLFFFQNLSSLSYEPGHYHMASHLWSLAVEEQFYLVWSILLLTAPRRLIPIMPWIFISMAYIFKVWCLMTGQSEWFLKVSTFGCMDSLAVGCLVAIAHANQYTRALRISRYFSVYLGVGLIFLITLCTSKQVISERILDYVFYDLSVYCLLWLLLDNAKNNYWKPVNRILTTKIFIYIGKISYGLYIYHQFVAWGNKLILDYLFDLNTDASGSILIFTHNFIATILVAHLSWTYFERKINNLKEKIASF